MGSTGAMQHVAVPSTISRLAREHGVDGEITCVPLWQSLSVLVVASVEEGLERGELGPKTPTRLWLVGVKLGKD